MHVVRRPLRFIPPPVFRPALCRVSEAARREFIAIRNTSALVAAASYKTSFVGPVVTKSGVAYATPSLIGGCVAAYYRTDLSALRSPRITARRVAMQRQVLHYLCYVLADVSTTTVGRFAHRNHATVLNSRDRIRRRLASGDGRLLNDILGVRRIMSEAYPVDPYYYGA